MATATDRSPGDHLCWPFHGMDGLVPSMRDYVRGGLDRHERVTFCRLTPTGIQYADLLDVGQVGLSPSADLPVLAPLAEDPAWRPFHDPVATLGPMTDAALADGCTGLRVLTDATDLARQPDSRDDWMRSEHLIDRYTRYRPLTVLCGYDVDDVGEDAVAEVACLHGLTGGMPTSFLLRAIDGDGRVALTGEVDRDSAPALYHAVTGILAATSGPLVLDLAEQEFVDHTGLVALHRAARAHGTHVHLLGASPLTALLVDAFALSGVRVGEEP